MFIESTHLNRIAKTAALTCARKGARAALWQSPAAGFAGFKGAGQNQNGHAAAGPAAVCKKGSAR